jgi:hypothetical protein
LELFSDVHQEFKESKPYCIDNFEIFTQIGLFRAQKVEFREDFE